MQHYVDLVDWLINNLLRYCFTKTSLIRPTALVAICFSSSQNQWHQFRNKIFNKCKRCVVVERHHPQGLVWCNACVFLALPIQLLPRELMIKLLSCSPVLLGGKHACDWRMTLAAIVSSNRERTVASCCWPGASFSLCRISRRWNYWQPNHEPQAWLV